MIKSTIVVKLDSGTNYKAYYYASGAAMTDTALTNFFINAGGQTKVIVDFNSGTPSSDTSISITDSNGNVVIGMATTDEKLADGYSYLAKWSAGTAPNSFTEFGYEQISLTNVQLSDIMKKSKLLCAEYSITSDTKLTDLWTYTVGTRTEYKGVAGVIVKNNSGSAKNLTLSTYTANNVSLPNGTSTPVLLFNTGALSDYPYISAIVTTNEGSIFLVQNSGTGIKKPVPFVEDTPASTNANGALSAKQGNKLYQYITGSASTGSYTSPRAWTSIGTGSNYTRRSFEVMLNISEENIAVTADTWTSLGITLPTGYRPSIVAFGSITANNNGAFEAGLVRVNTDGTVEVKTTNATTDVYGSIMFPIVTFP